MNATMLRRALGVAACLWAAGAAGQAPAPAAAETKPAAAETKPAAAETKSAEAAAADPLAEFAWLAGCWRGESNRREFREQWMPPRGGMLVGVSQTVVGNRTASYEYLRLERRPDGIHYVVVTGGTAESSLKFDRSRVDGGVATYTFVNPALEFPRELVYRREPGGRLYATLSGKVRGADQELVYPMRRIDCESGEPAL